MKFNYEDQKFFEGDLVRVAKDLGPTMFHFPCDQEAVVLYSYADAYPSGANVNKDDTKKFNVFLLKDKTSSAWYREDQLELIRTEAYDRLPDNHPLVQKRKAIAKRNSEIKQ